MTDFWFYISLGFDHVLDWRGFDHMLFLAVLVMGYSPKDWRKIVSLVTLFTIGHMASLAYASINILEYNEALVEFLIPVTILLTAIYKALTTYKKTKINKPWLLYIGTLFFGLIHGLGFASYFRTLDEVSVWPLTQFALGIESAQLVVVVTVILLGLLFTRVIGVSNTIWTYFVCAITVLILIPMLIDSWPF